MTCHYLNKKSYDCSLSKGGVFIPLQAHFDQFCMTDNFMQCDYYCRFASKSGEGNSPFASPGRFCDRGRRQFARKREQFAVDLCPCDHSGVMALESDEKAYVLDYSQGGLRVRASHELNRGGMLNFKFGHDFIVPQLEGLASVRWQKPCHGEEEGPWEAGLAFESQFVKAMIAVQMAP